jgi:hypothetical protein
MALSHHDGTDDASAAGVLFLASTFVRVNGLEPPRRVPHGIPAIALNSCEATLAMLYLDFSCVALHGTDGSGPWSTVIPMVNGHTLCRVQTSNHEGSVREQQSESRGRIRYSTVVSIEANHTLYASRHR